MNTFAILLTFFLSVKISATPLLIDNMSIHYSHPSGEGVFEKLKIGEYLYESPNNFSLDHKDQQLSIRVNEEEVILNDENNFLSNVQNFELDRLFVNQKEAEINVEFNEIVLEEPESSWEIKKLKAKCELASPFINNTSSFLSDCLTNSSIRISSVLINKVIKNSLMQLVEGLGDDDFPSERPTIANLRLRIANNNFSLKLRLNDNFNVTLKIRGKVQYLKEENSIHLTITKAKASFFDIKKRIFKALKEHEGPKLEVRSPHVFIYLD